MGYDSKEMKSLGSYKDDIYKMIVNDEELGELFIDLVMPILDDDRLDKVDNFIGGDYIINVGTGQEKISLIGRLFDVPFIYACITEKINTVCLDVNITKDSRSTKEMSIYFYVVCHKSNLRLDDVTKKKYRDLGYVGNRLDIMVAILNDIINHSCTFGIGELQPVQSNPVKSYYPDNDYFGKIIEYRCSDFMIDYSERSLNGN